MKNLKNVKISSSELSSIFGGQELNTSQGDGRGNTICDIHYDDNNDGAINAGECVEFVNYQ